MNCKTSVRFFLFLFASLTSFIFSHETTFPYPIDIVYLWVDGSDPHWRNIKNKYADLQEQSSGIIEEAATDNRFRDHEELKYSLRSVLQFAPFFRHIFIVTMNQHPNWLADHPQITIIDHKEIFKNSNDLPTFNSHAIEANLHRIPGLSEHFIYFNDDVFLGLPVSPYDFFTEEGKIKVLFERGYTISANPIVQASPYRKAWVNSNALLDGYFQEERRHRLCHSAFSFRKSWIEQAESLFPFVFDGNASHKFRSPEDFNITNGLLQYIFLYQERIEKGNMMNKMVSMQNDFYFDQNARELTNLLINPIHTFCLQDCIEGQSEKTQELLSNFLNTYFPDPAPWEKDSSK
jgi:hypothetical protein